MPAVALNPISFVTGTLGAGKSYYSMRRVFEYLSAGKVVALNFDLVGEWWSTLSRFGLKRRLTWSGDDRYLFERDVRGRAFRFEDQDDLYDFDLPGDPDLEDRGLLVLDEGALRLNRRDARTRRGRDKQVHSDELKELEFYVNMRKLGWTCLILSQSAKMLDDQVLALGGAEVRLRNFARVRMPLIGVPMSKNPRFLAIHYWPEVSAVTGREFYGLNKAVAKHYKSNQRFSRSEDRERGMRLQAAWSPLGRAVQSFEDWSASRAQRRTERPERSEDAPTVREHARCERYEKISAGVGDACSTA